MTELTYGHIIYGPAIIIDKLSTILIEPLCKATVDSRRNIKIDVMNCGLPQKFTTELDAIRLSIFSHRFMSVAEQMGR